MAQGFKLDSFGLFKNVFACDELRLDQLVLLKTRNDPEKVVAYVLYALLFQHKLFSREISLFLTSTKFCVAKMVKTLKAELRLPILLAWLNVSRCRGSGPTSNPMLPGCKTCAHQSAEGNPLGQVTRARD